MTTYDMYVNRLEDIIIQSEREKWAYGHVLSETQERLEKMLQIINEYTGN